MNAQTGPFRPVNDQREFCKLSQNQGWWLSQKLSLNLKQCLGLSVSDNQVQ